VAIKAKRNQPEADFRRKLMQMARLLGYRAVHFKTSLTAKGQHLTTYEGDGKGYPDVFLGRPAAADRPARLIWVETKAGKNPATPEQKEYLEYLRGCGAEAYLWSERNWGEAVEVLRR
jgi:hypothetical protein